MDEKRPIATVAIAGSPNTGKTTIFNGLTGMRQHTGNWHGKTTSLTCGAFSMNHQKYQLIDLPGLLSPAPFLEYEKAAWDYLNSGNAQMILMVCDATCLERDLHLLRKILFLDRIRDLGTPVILCVNFWDEAEKRGIEIDFKLLQDVLQIPVLSCCAFHGESLNQIRQTIYETYQQRFFYDCLDYCPAQLARETIGCTYHHCIPKTDLAERVMMEPAAGILFTFFLLLGLSWLTLTGAFSFSTLLWKLLFVLESPLAATMSWIGSPPWLISILVYHIYRSLALIFSLMLPCMTLFFFSFDFAEDAGCLPKVAFHLDSSFRKCRTCSKQCLSMAIGFCCNAAAITQSRILSSSRERKIAVLTSSFVPCSRKLPTLLLMISLIFMAGASPALPPGKREIFPGISSPIQVSLFSALLLCFIICFCITSVITGSWILSHTLLPGNSCPFVLELPPCRCPGIHRTLKRSFQDQTIPAMRRAVISTTASVGFTWFLIYRFPGVFDCILHLLEPLGRCMGLDGIILFAFLLSIPANETVIPIMITLYLHTSNVSFLDNSPLPAVDFSFLTKAAPSILQSVSRVAALLPGDVSCTLQTIENPSALFSFLASQGWTCTTILSMIVFCLFHWPCASTIRNIKKETGSWKWTAVSVLFPFMFGMVLCILVTAVSHMIFG